MTTQDDNNSRRDCRARWFAALAFLAALLVYALTAYPTITWWDSASYSCAAVVLGITPPPGSLLLVILGWLVLQLPTGLEAAYTLNLFAAVIGAMVVAFMSVLAFRTWAPRRDRLETARPRTSVGFGFGAVAGVLAYAFAVSVWRHAIKFNPYILTTLFTVLILWVLIRWWDDAGQSEDWSWFVFLGLLIGLDFSVHRTNFLLIPGVVLWIAIRRFRSLLSPRVWFASAGGFLVGLSFHLLLLPLSSRNPVINMGDPSTFARFYDYVSLKQFGGGFLMNLWERNSALWSNQTLDILRTLGDNLFWTTGTLRILGVFSGALALVGWAAVLRRRSRFAIAYLLTWLVTFAVTVFYFNIPENFFRSFDRHYLPLMVTLGVMMGVGGGVILNSVWKLRRSFSRHMAALVFLLLLLAPAGQFFRNYNVLDGSRSYFAYDFAHNTLSAVPEKAILFANGDNDTWPTLYVQVADGFRRDVHLVNLPLSNTPWYLQQLPEVDLDYPVHYTDSTIRELRSRHWPDTTITLPPPPGFTRQNATSDSDRVRGIQLHCAPTVSDEYARTQDLALLELIQKNNWRRPICFYATVYSQNYLWVGDHVRQDGMHLIVLPETDPQPIDTILAHNLFDVYDYRGYNDHTIPLDGISRHMGSNFSQLFLQLCALRQNRGDWEGCRDAKERMMDAFPFERMEPPEQMQEAVLRMCVPPDDTEESPNSSTVGE